MLDDDSPPYALRHALGLLLESFVRTYREVPERAHAVSDAKELPDRLRHLTERHPPLSTWRAWRDDVRLWFVIGRLSTECCRSRDSLLLEGGAEVILECARFYYSYAYFKKDKNRYEILDVIGPDGAPVTDAVGELAVLGPFVGMTAAFC